MYHPLKITSTLADETRFQIYEFMLQQKRNFTVQDIAEQFSIHPNVARLHLTKLSEIDLITADFIKSGKGGRPGRVYKAADQGIELSFPKKEDTRLIKWAIKIIEELGPSALETAKNISYADGYEQMKTLIGDNRTKPFLNINEKIQILSTASSMIGYIPQIINLEEGKKILFTIYNCPFKNHLSTNNEMVCTLHESYLKGQIDALFSQNEFDQIESILHDCDFCKYEIEVSEKAL